MDFRFYRPDAARLTDHIIIYWKAINLDKKELSASSSEYGS